MVSIRVSFVYSPLEKPLVSHLESRSLAHA
jgi:hypothetical protein